MYNIYNKLYSPPPFVSSNIFKIAYSQIQFGKMTTAYSLPDHNIDGAVVDQLQVLDNLYPCPAGLWLSSQHVEQAPCCSWHPVARHEWAGDMGANPAALWGTV